MNTIRELTQQEKYNTMLKRKNREIKSLKEQLEYLRSNEYLNQVKWERDINEKLNDDYKLVIEKLEKENKVLKELNVCVGCEDNPSYKSRIDKAIEYIEKNWIEYSDFQYVDNDDELNIDCESIKELFDILKGSDK